MDNLAVAKLTPQGDLDNAFGYNGFASNVASISAGCDAIELDEEGNIFVFCSESFANPSVVAFTPEGGPLISFSPTGKRTVPFPDIVFDVSGGLISSDEERLYVYGGVIAENMHCAIVAMDMQGNLVEEFDGDGILEEDFINPYTELIYSIAENETGLYLTVVNFPWDDVNTAIVHLDHTGTPVEEFDDNGVYVYNIAFQQEEKPGEITFQSDGSLVFCGNVDYESDWFNIEGFVARVRPGTSTSSVEDNKKAALKVFPNPARNEVFISLSDLSLVGESYKVYNSFGKLVSLGRLGGAQHRVDVTDLSPGLFHLVVESGTTVRFIKK
jgi:hypothetical protein